VSRAVASDGWSGAVLFFVLAGVAPLTSPAGVKIPRQHMRLPELTGIPAAFVLVAVILASAETGYVAMTRPHTNRREFTRLSPAAWDAPLVSPPPGRAGAYSFLRWVVRSARPAARARHRATWGVHLPWWGGRWQLGVVTVLGQDRCLGV